MNEAYWEKYRSTVDRQVEEADLSRSLSHLPSAGKPLPGAGRPYEENWWAKEFVRREKVPSAAYLPTSLQLRKEKEELGEDLARLTGEADARAVVSELNRRIDAWLRNPTPPHVALSRVDEQEALRTWRERRDAASTTTTSAPPSTGVPSTAVRPGWWRRLTDRGRP